jgi:arsenite methyltransferase
VSRDLMFRNEIQQLVADAYEGLDRPAAPGQVFYDEAQLASLPAATREWMLGVGNPVPCARLRPGERVADLGCGAGVDVLLAADAVGDGGHVTGVDMLPSMVRRAHVAATAAGVGNVSFVAAEMESLPLADGSVDVVVNNGSINLCARKSRVLAEAYRILRPGGRMSLADLTVREEDLPAEVLTHPSAWAG